VCFPQSETSLQQGGTTAAMEANHVRYCRHTWDKDDEVGGVSVESCGTLKGLHLRRGKTHGPVRGLLTATYPGLIPVFPVEHIPGPERQLCSCEIVTEQPRKF
jgi:hypothetical protein